MTTVMRTGLEKTLDALNHESRVVHAAEPHRRYPEGVRGRPRYVLTVLFLRLETSRMRSSNRSKPGGKDASDERADPIGVGINKHRVRPTRSIGRMPYQIDPKRVSTE